MSGAPLTPSHQRQDEYADNSLPVTRLQKDNADKSELLNPLAHKIIGVC